jgi:hypothetical protein
MKHLERFEIPDEKSYLQLINLCCEWCEEEFNRTLFEFNNNVGKYINCDWCNNPIFITQ